MAAEIDYRPARAEDAEGTFEVVRESTDDLLRRNGRDPSAGAGLPPERVIRFRHSCVRHDPDRFWVAEASGLMVGAGFAILRDHAWYLAGLHVLPGWQGQGIGAELIRRTLSGTDPGTSRSVLTDTLNPDSNGLYLRAGMLPQGATLTFDGSPSPRTGRASMETRPLHPDADAGAIDALDRATVGFGRPVDHAFWAGVPGLTGRLLVADARILGYLYVSDHGAIGPLAVHDPADLPAALDTAAALAREAGATALHVRTFGTGHTAIRWAIGSGLRLTGTGLLLGTAPIGRFDGYVTSGADALY